MPPLCLLVLLGPPMLQISSSNLSVFNSAMASLASTQKALPVQPRHSTFRRRSRRKTAANSGACWRCKEEFESKLLQASFATLGFYREAISPILPNKCRLIPSCSRYSIQALQEYGLWRGLALTAWRLARCNPLGPPAWSYDPPVWPPPAFRTPAGAQGGEDE